MSIGPYSSAAAANAVLAACEARSCAVDPMKLQKLIYLTHGYYLAAAGVPWLDEAFQAWQYGPVLPSIYQEFKRYGARTIPPGDRVVEAFYEGARGFIQQPVPAATNDDEVGTRMLDWVVTTYGHRPAVYLSELTHKVGSPWDTAKHRDRSSRRVEIPNDEIKRYYDRLVTKRADA